MSGGTSAKILAVATTVPSDSFDQAAMVKLLDVRDPQCLRFFQHPHVEKRHFIFPQNARGLATMAQESHAELRRKFLAHAPRLVAQTLSEALSRASCHHRDVGYIVCVTSSGFFSPGLSSILANHVPLTPSVQRVDVVGMGCNAGLNGLQVVRNWCEANPGQVAVLVCCELNSCAYTLDPSPQNALANSLFGDGVAVAVVGTSAPPKSGPRLLRFASHLIPQTLDHLAFHWDDVRHLYAFRINKETPERLGAAVRAPVEALLAQEGLRLTDVRHWVVHGGGEAILAAIQAALEIPAEGLRHSRSVLRDYGNVASGSFLFSYERLVAEEAIAPGDYGLAMTMGPGLSLELSLVRW